MTIITSSGHKLAGTHLTGLPKKLKWKPHSIVILPRKINDPAFTKKFLRLNDRKKYFYIEDFRKAGYHCEYLSNKIWPNDPAVKEWCNTNVGPNWCTMGPWFIFQSKQDALAFKMVWG